MAVESRISPRPSRRLESRTRGTSPSRRPRPEEPDRFAQVLAKVAEQSALETEPRRAIEVLLTFGGRVPVAVGAAALPSRQRATYSVVADRLLRRGEVQLAVGASPGLPLISRTGMAPDGRTFLTAPVAGSSPEPPPASVGAVLTLAWTTRAGAAYRSALARAEREMAEGEARVAEWIAAVSEEEIAATLNLLHSVGAHAAPLLLYVEDEVFSNFRENNLTGKVLLPTSPHSVFRRLAETPREEWSRGEAMLIFCARLLLRAEGPQGVEEFNGAQLTPVSVSDHFARKLEILRGLGAVGPGSPPAPGWAARTALATDKCAAAVAEMSPKVPRELDRYRRIYGVNLHKEVHWRSGGAGAVDSLVEPLGEAIAAKWGAAPADEAGYRRFLAEWTPAVVAGEVLPANGGYDSAFEELIADVLTIAGARTDSEIALSRGLRSLRRLTDALEREEWEQIVGWELPHYYCCVLAGERLRAEFDADPAGLADLLWSIAARMQYNSWHFLPANLPGTRFVTERDYFYPPTIPDIASWSDLHHRGHVAGGVRYAIRAPRPVTVRERELVGFVDVRLMRRGGLPFGMDDLRVGVAASALIAAAVESLARCHEDPAVDLPVTGFDAEWYTRRVAAEGSRR